MVSGCDEEKQVRKLFHCCSLAVLTLSVISKQSQSVGPVNTFARYLLLTGFDNTSVLVLHIIVYQFYGYSHLM